MQQTSQIYKQQSGSILILLLITLSTLLFVVLASINRTVQHAHLLSNYQNHLKSLKNSELCLLSSIKQITKSGDARFWSKNTNPPTRGLYNRVDQPPIDIKQFNWNPTSIGLLGNSCRYIIEYLGTISEQDPSSRSRHILRISILYQSQKPFRRVLQATISVIFNKKELPSIVFKLPPTLQQWVQVN